MLSWQSRLDPRDLILCLKERNKLGFETWKSSLGSPVSLSKFPETRIFQIFIPWKEFQKKKLLFSRGKEKWPFFSSDLSVSRWLKKQLTHVSTRLKKDTITILSLCISKNQHPSPSSMQMLVSHEPSLVALALMSLLWLSGRASCLLTRRL